MQALELIEQWILNMAKSNNSDQKDELLTYLTFQLGQVNLAKIIESDYNLIQYHKHENVFNQLVELYPNNSDISNIYRELVKDVPLKCQVNAPNFVILTP
ncbi:44983_t:CDS:2, partial [Gigaspora margarita]